MTWQRQTLGLALGLAFLSGALRAGEILSSFPDRVLFVAKFNVDKVKQVPPVKQALGTQISKVASFIGQIRNWTGVDLETVKTFWIGVEKKDFAVIVLEGRFDIEVVKAALAKIPTAQTIPKKDVPIMVQLPDDKNPGKFNMAAVLNPTTLVFGQPGLTESFVDVYSGASPSTNAAVQPQLAVLKDSQALLHGVIFGLDPAELQKTPFLAYLERGELKGDLDKDLLLSLAVGVKKPEMLQSLAKAADGVLGFMRQMEPTTPSGNQGEAVKRRLLENVTVTVENDRVVLRSKLDEALLSELIGGKLQ